MTIREQIQATERTTLSAHAAQSADSRGRAIPEPEDEIRTPFQRDRDRILHSKAFRRLKGKTQVFLSPEGDHYRTRLTHTLEVAQISRTVGRALRLNEDLVEAIALGHDLGHTPFGHAGESVLARLNPDGFHHSKQSLRVVEEFEQHGSGRGLNLTAEVKDGIRRHSKGLGRLADVREKAPSSTLEAEVVRLCDCVAYANHDLDDALRARFVRADEIPAQVNAILGDRFSRRVNTLVLDIIHASADRPVIALSAHVEAGLEALRSFLVERVYKSPLLTDQFARARQVLDALYAHYLEHPEEIKSDGPPDAPLPQRVCDFIAGMTDRFALAQFQKHLVPHPWDDED